MYDMAIWQPVVGLQLSVAGYGEEVTSTQR